MKRYGLILFGAVVLFSGFNLLILYVGKDMQRTQRKIRMAQMWSEAVKLHNAVTNYANTFGGIPAGENSAIIAALTGQNSSNVVYLTLDTDRVDSTGRFLDYWGTPYRITLTETNLGLTSAGRNRTFGDHDDLVTARNLIAE